MDFNNISLCADPTNCFSTGPQPTESGQDIASGQANFGPFSVGISPARAPIHLSQAAGAATDYAREYRDLISKNIAAISSDEAVCHLKLPHALPANTSGIFDQSKKKRLKSPEKPDELFERLTGFKDFFRKDSKDTEGKKVDFPSGADISPHHASIDLSQAGKVTTDTVLYNNTSRFENGGAVSSDEAVSHRKVARALPENTSIIYGKSDKTHDKFAREFNEYFKTLTGFENLFGKDSKDQE